MVAISQYISNVKILYGNQDSNIRVQNFTLLIFWLVNF